MPKSGGIFLFLEKCHQPWKNANFPKIGIKNAHLATLTLSLLWFVTAAAETDETVTKHETLQP